MVELHGEQGTGSHPQGVVANNEPGSHFHRAGLGTHSSERITCLWNQGSNVSPAEFQNCNRAVTMCASHVSL